MKNVSLKLFLLCAVACFANFPAFAGKTAADFEEESCPTLKEISIRVLPRKWSEEKASAQEIHSILLEQVPDAFLAPLLKSLPVEVLTALSDLEKPKEGEPREEESEKDKPKKILMPYLVEALEEHEVTIFKKEKKAEEFFAVSAIGEGTYDTTTVKRLSERKVLLQGTFLEIMKGPFTNLRICPSWELAPDEIECLSRSPVRRLRLEADGFQNIFFKNDSESITSYFQNLCQLHFFKPLSFISMAEIIKKMRTQPCFQGLTHLSFSHLCFSPDVTAELTQDLFFCYLTHLRFDQSLHNQNAFDLLIRSKLFEQLTHFSVDYYSHFSQNTGGLNPVNTNSFKNILQRGLKLQYLELIRHDINFDELNTADTFEVSLDHLTHLILKGEGLEGGKGAANFFLQNHLRFKKLEHLTLEPCFEDEKEAIEKNDNFKVLNFDAYRIECRIAKPQEAEDNGEREKDENSKIQRESNLLKHPGY